MSSKTRPTKPRPAGPYVRSKIQDADMDIASAENDLTPLVEGGDLNATRASRKLWKARHWLAVILGLGVDNSDNGQNGGHE